MSTRRRSPLVLVSTAAALDSILSRNCSRAGLQDTGPNGSISKLLPIDKGNPSTVLRVGLLLTSNDSSGAGSSIDTEDSLTLDKLLKQRGGSNDLTGFDELTTVGVSASLLRRLSISSGSWVFLKDTKTNVVKPARVMVLDPPGSFPTSRRCCRESDTTPTRPSSMNKSFPIFNLLCPIDSVVDAEVAYLSPMLAFNLGLHISWLEFLTSCASDGKDWSELLELKGENSGAWNNFSSSRYHSVAISPFIPAFDPQLAEDGHLQDETLVRSGQRAESPRMRYASHMRVGLVRIPSDSLVLPSMKGRQAEIDASLQDFFRVNRFLGKGDIFSVQLGHGRGPIEGHTALYHDSANAAPRNEWLLFKVLALEPSTELLLCVNHVHTALVLGGSVAAQLPPLSWTPRLRRAFLPTPAVQQLTSLLAPCLHPRVPPLQLRISVLIHGPSGSGKQTVLRLAAEDLGMHVVAFNCYDFVGATEGKTTAAVVNSFKTAKRYSPSILLLRHFDALAKLSSGGSSPGDQQGSVSRVASILKMCIQAHLPSSLQDNDNDEWPLNDEATDGEGLGSGVKEGLVLMVAACESAESLVPSFRRCFTHEVAVGMPNEDERLALLHHYLGIRSRKNGAIQESNLDEGVEASLKLIASQTSGLTPRDLRAVAADTGAVAITRLVQNGQSVQKENDSQILEEPTNSAVGIGSHFNGAIEVNDAGTVSMRQTPVEVSSEDLEKVLKRVKLRTASAIGTPKVPNVKWEDVGGLEDVKKAILDTVQLPLQHRELFASGLRQRSGVLLYGPPGTGKTLLAKAVATECSLNFLSVKGPELINMYIGESEKNVREIFQKARMARPCVVFFDELDALAPARGASGDSGGVMDRVVSQLLAEIDGVSDNSQDLFIIGASNRPDLIDAALLRPGRFDKLLYVGVSSENSYRERVLEALTRKFVLDKNVSLKALAERCPVNYTGADMYALCADAWHQAVKREVSRLEWRSNTDKEAGNTSVVVKQEDFLKALRELTPSLSRAELERYERLRVQFEGSSRAAGRPQ